jgi:hypothetical protein
LILAVSLSPVPEIDDYRLSEKSSQTTIKNSHKTIQALIHNEQEQSDEYYKRIEIAGSESNYTTMNGNNQEDYSIGDQQTDRSSGNGIDGGGSIIISVPTMLRQEDETTYGGDSIYNQNYSIQSFNKNQNRTIVVGYCQTDFQPLDPKLLLKSTDKSLLADHKQYYSYSQSLQLSTYDSGFFDDETMNSLASTTTIQSQELDESTNECMNIDDNQEDLSTNRQK